MASRRVRLWLSAVAVVMFVANAHAQQSGTLMTQTATLLKGAADPSFEISVLGGSLGKPAGATTKVFVEIGTDGNAATPPPDPGIPAAVRFKVSKTGVANSSEFTTMGGSDATTFPQKLVLLQKGDENTADPRGLYVLGIIHNQGVTANTSEVWKLELTNLPAGFRIVASVQLGTFTALTPTGVCSGESTPQPCPNVCKPGYSCQPLWVFPWWKYAQLVYLPKWPPIPDPCLSCPEPWKRPAPDGFDRVFVGITPYLKENAPLGPGRAGDIKVAIDGGEAVGPVFDVGNGTYMQLVQHRHGDAPRVRAAVGDVTTEEIVIGPTSAGGVDPLFRTLTFVLAGLLLIALIALARRRAAARG